VTRHSHKSFYPRNRRWLEPVIAALVVLLAMLAIAAPGHCEEVSLASDALPLFGAGLVDFGATEWALQSPGLREANPFGSTTSKRIAIKTATNAGALLIVRRLRASGKPGAAKWTKRGLIAVQVLAGGWAIHVGRGAK
jgi:hypothetical protein